MKKRIIPAILALIIIFSCCACSKKNDEAVAPTPSASQSAEPETALERWLNRAEKRYNMDYESFNDYWCLLCDEYFGDSMHSLLTAVAACKNTSYSDVENAAQIKQARAKYKKLGGKDWHFEIAEHKETPLSAQTCENFSAELKSLHDKMCAVTDKAQYWSDSEWQSFASSLGCDVDSAKKIIDSYWAIASKCKDVKVTSAAQIDLTVKFSDGSTVSDSTTLYEIDGEYVSTELIDSASMLLQLIYF